MRQPRGGVHLRGVDHQPPETVMAKGLDKKKEEKKKPEKTLKEKRAAKKEKKAGH